MDAGEGEPNATAYTDEDCHQEQHGEAAEDEDQTNNVLDYAIEYRMRGSYPSRLT